MYQVPSYLPYDCESHVLHERGAGLDPRQQRSAGRRGSSRPGQEEEHGTISIPLHSFSCLSVIFCNLDAT